MNELMNRGLPTYSKKGKNSYCCYRSGKNTSEPLVKGSPLT